jgi:hypothetical protein
MIKVSGGHSEKLWQAKKYPLALGWAMLYQDILPSKNCHVFHKVALFQIK